MLHRQHSLFESRKYYKPFDYPEFIEFWKQQQDMFWLPTEICLSNDKTDFEQKLTEDERQILMKVFKIFTHTDFSISDGYLELLHYFQNYEVRIMILSFINMETIHASAYAMPIEIFNIDEQIHQEYKNFNILMKKHNFMQWHKIKKPIDVLLLIAKISVITEGYLLFSSFALLLNLPKQNILNGIGQITTFSMRDESLHHEAMVYLYNLTKKQMLERKMITIEEVNALEKQLNHLIAKTLEIEFDTIDFMFNNGQYKMRNITPENIKHYIIRLANVRTKKIGAAIPKHLINMYDKNKDMLWIDEMVKLREHVDFFASRPTEYKKAKICHVDDSCFK